MQQQPTCACFPAAPLFGTIRDSSEHTRALKGLGIALVQAGQWAEAERVTATIRDSSEQTNALIELGTALAQAGLKEQASRFPPEAERAIPTHHTSPHPTP